MHERVNKSSSWTPTSIQKKSKNLHAKPSTSIQPKPENISSQQQEIPTYSTAAADWLAANIMRSLEPKEQEPSKTSTGKPQSESGQAAFPSIAASIPSTPVVQPQEIGIQRQCSECAKEQSTEEGRDIDEISLAASGIQTKLTIGAPPNPYQQATNQMAEVMSKPILYAPMPQVQGIQQARGGGQGLDESVRKPMEGAFGADFSGVRVHTDANSDVLNRSISARAFTTGQDIFFKQGEYEPGSRGGQELLAHELTHVVQQTGRVETKLLSNQSYVQCKPENEAALKDIQGYPMFALLPKLKDLPDEVRQDEEAGRFVGGPRLVTAIRVVQAKGTDWLDFAIAHKNELFALPFDQITDIMVFLGTPKDASPCQILEGRRQTGKQDFDRAWFENIAMPILDFEKYQDGAKIHDISLQKRILMTAHARAESTAQAQDKSGQFISPEGLNVFNVQVNAGTPGSKTVTRAEYLRKVPQDEIDKIDLNATVPVKSGNQTVQWKRYDTTSPTEIKELVFVKVGIPMYPSMKESVQGYFNFLKKPFKGTFDALTEDKQGTMDFINSLKKYGTHRNYKDPKHMQEVIAETAAKLVKFSNQRIAELQQTIAQSPKTQTPSLDKCITQLKDSLKQYESIKSEAQKMAHP